MFRPFFFAAEFLSPPRRSYSHSSLLIRASLSSPPSLAVHLSRARALISDYFVPPPGSGINSRGRVDLFANDSDGDGDGLSRKHASINVELIRSPTIKINGYFHQGRLTLIASWSCPPRRRLIFIPQRDEELVEVRSKSADDGQVGSQMIQGVSD